MVNVTKFTALRTVLTLAVGSVLTIGGYSTFQNVTQTSGTYVVRTNAVIYGSGGQLPIYQSVTLSETAGVSSGSVSIRNPYDKTLLCWSPTIRVTTAASPTTVVDIWTATGAVGTTAATGVTLLYNDMTLSAQVTTLTGGSIPGSRFVLGPYSSTTVANRINLKAKKNGGSGQNLVGTLFMPCNALD